MAIDMNAKMIEQSIFEEKAELQCLESCEAIGFTLQDYIDAKKETIKCLEILIASHDGEQ